MEVIQLFNEIDTYNKEHFLSILYKQKFQRYIFPHSSWKYVILKIQLNSTIHKLILRILLNIVFQHQKIIIK